jgi:hypothetical protein
MQVIAAQEQAVELLHDVSMKEAIEGHCEPIFWQGIPIGHVLKVDNRLRIEMLRAHMPAKFKTPGSGPAATAINAPGGSVLVVDAAVQAERMAMRQESLRVMAEEKAKAIEVSSVP